MSRLRRFLWYCLLLLPCMFLAAVLYLNGRNRTVRASGTRAAAGRAVAAAASVPVSASVDNWGLSFPKEGESPIGNAVYILQGNTYRCAQ